ncbi:MAG: hypothetical protein AB1791_03850, partial [Chloroflexota bacterium]
EDRKDFDRLRGGNDFAKVFRELRPKEESPFKIDGLEKKTVEQGHEFQVFRGHVQRDWLFPTFSLDPEKAPSIPANLDWAGNGEKFQFHVRLSRTGFLEVKLTKYLGVPDQPDSGEGMIGLLKNLLQVGSYGKDENRQSIQLQQTLECANLFVEALPSPISITQQGEKKPVSISLQQIALDSESLERQRYAILFLDAIWCKKCNKRISADRFWERDRKTVAAILEGALIQTGSGLRFPELDEANMEQFKDLATWQEELCIFTPERCLIYYPPEKIFLPGQLTPEAVHYEDYWKCIVRGIEHTVALRAALQITEGHTTHELDKIPHLTKRVTDGHISKEDEKQILGMAQEVSNTFNMLPILRDVLVPTASFRASYAVNKFAYLNTVLHLKDTEEHIQRNVDELVIFLNHFSGVRLHESSVNLELYVSLVGVALAAVAFLVAGPSFLEDFHSFFVEQYTWSEWTVWIFFALIGYWIVILALIPLTLTLIRNMSRRR